MIVQEILAKKGSEVYHTTPDTSVFDAISLMAAHDVGALIVMKKNRLKGIISERDYRNKVILMGRTSKQTPVKDIMTSNVLCVSPDETIEKCMGIMTTHKIRHLPVLTRDKKLAGIISIGDLVKSIIDKQEIEITDMKNYIAGSYPG
ncbi:MAG: CBS domain-containing protein [Balneolales bacterium]